MWYDAYNNGLMLYARNWLNKDTAQDVVQAAFVKLMSQIKVPRDVKAWLFRIVRNEPITCLRRQERQLRHGSRFLREREPWFESQPEDLIDAQSARELLTTLPAELREVVVLRVWGQCSFTQISTVIGCSVSTVHGRYKTALASMKERMQRSCRTKTN